MDLFEMIVMQAPNFIGLVISILILVSDNKSKQQTIDKLVDIIVTRAYCDDDDDHA